MKLQEADIYLATLSREDCKILWNDFEYDFDNPTEELNIGHSDEKANDWFDDIQKLQGNRHIRLGIRKNYRKHSGYKHWRSKTLEQMRFCFRRQRKKICLYEFRNA